MTRINVTPVSELSDQWLIAEYRELPRVIKQDICIDDAPTHYKLGKGHMKWAKLHSLFTVHRYKDICNEMKHRGFKVNYPYVNLLDVWDGVGKNYTVSEIDIAINRKRLIERFNNKHKWTERKVPTWLKQL